MGYISLVWDDRVLQTWHNCLYFFTKECVWLCVGLSTAFFLSFFLSHLFFVVSFLRSICCEHGMKKKDRDLWKSHSKGARDSKSSWKPNRTDDELYEVFLVLRLYVLRMRWASVVLTIQHTFICLLYRRVFLPIIRTLRCYMESGQDYCKVGSIIWIEFFFSFAAAAAAVTSSSFFDCVFHVYLDVGLFAWLTGCPTAISKEYCVPKKQKCWSFTLSFFYMCCVLMLCWCALHACLLRFFSLHFSAFGCFFVQLSSLIHSTFYCQTLRWICIALSLKTDSVRVSLYVPMDISIYVICVYALTHGAYMIEMNQTFAISIVCICLMH